MKLVIEYQSAGCFECSSYEIIRCCEHESDVAFLVEFEEALMKAIEKRDNINKQWKKWQKQRPVQKHKKDLSFLEQDTTNWLAQAPDRYSDDVTTFIFANMKFELELFVYKDGPINLPVVSELTDWFAKRTADMDNY